MTASARAFQRGVAPCPPHARGAWPRPAELALPLGVHDREVRREHGHRQRDEQDAAEHRAARGRARLFLKKISERADGERRRPVPVWKVSEDASRRDLSDATLRFGLALGVRRRHAPERLLKIDPRSDRLAPRARGERVAVADRRHRREAPPERLFFFRRRLSLKKKAARWVMRIKIMPGHLVRQNG